MIKNEYAESQSAGFYTFWCTGTNNFNMYFNILKRKQL